MEKCMICGAPIEDPVKDVPVDSWGFYKKENSTVPVDGRHVCDDCHAGGYDSIIGACMEETSKDPVVIIRKMMEMPFCHMHGPEHHVMVGAALLTAYKNAGGDIDLLSALIEMINRGRKVPGRACGLWGACGAGISSGMFVSIITGSTPFTQEPFALANKMTSRSLNAIGEIGGPRCCKRDSYLSILSAVDFVKEQLGVEMERSDIVCCHSAQNGQCIGKRCPFFRETE